MCEIESLEYLQQLAELVDEPENDPACVCCAWAVKEIKRLRLALQVHSGIRSPFGLSAQEQATVSQALRDLKAMKGGDV